MNILETIEDNPGATLALMIFIVSIVLIASLYSKTYSDNEVAKEAIKAGYEQNDKGQWVKPKSNEVEQK
jgi:hypothetical protein